MPCGGLWLEQPHEQATRLLSEVAVRGRVLEDGKVRVHTVEGLGDEVVVLGCLQGHTDADRVAELSTPDAGGKDDDLRLDHPEVRDDAGDAVSPPRDPGDGDTLEDRGAALARSLGE